MSDENVIPLKGITISAIFHLNGYLVDLVLGPDHSRSSSPYPLQVFTRLVDQGLGEFEVGPFK